MTPSPPSPEGLPDKLIYVIADIHGRLDLLEAAADAIMAHLAGRSGRVITLGDYVDRGPDSRGVIEFLMRAQRKGGATCLKGNHEDMMVRACRERDGQSAFHWFMNGGDATLASYGGTGLTEASLDLVPDEHLDWIAGLPTTATDGHRFYVHACLMPNVPVAEQDDETHLWIREKFLRANRPDDFPDGKHIVHGHTPSWACKPDPSKPELLPYRTNLDTAAFLSGVLTVVVSHPDKPGGPIDVLTITLPHPKEQP